MLKQHSVDYQFYLESGGVTEYCKGYGLPFQNENLENTLEQFIKDYKILKN